MKVIGFNHFTIEVRDVKHSVVFYIDILGLSEMNRPNFDFEGAWISMGGNQSIHLVQNQLMNEVAGGSRKLHFAFEVEDIYGFKDYLVSQGIVIIKDIKARPDGVLQLFVRDPDGYFIELTQIV